METINFKEGIAKLDLATLQRTVSYEMAKGGLSKTRPIEHHNLISELCDRASNIKGIDLKVDPIYATERQAMRIMHAGNKEDCPVEKYLIQRLTTRIQLISKEDKEMNMAIGLSYNEKGITLAMGPNIWICSNQNVFGNNLMSTYKSNRMDKLPFDKMFQVVESWISNYEEKRNNDYGKIELMQNTIVERGSIPLLYGELIKSAVLFNMNAVDNSPMNITQVTDFIRQSKSEEYEVPVTENVKVWDLAQMGTAVLKPHRNDFTTSYQSLNNFNNFLLKKYELN